MIKKRNWGFVLYPESAPSDWMDSLKIKGITFAVSPLHDKDVNPTGEKKKEHYHVILSFGSPTTFNNVKAITDELNQPIPISLESVRGYFRYFTHKDNPEKYQYDEKEIKLFNGFDVTDVLNNFEVYQFLKEIQLLILENDITEYSDLLDYLMEQDFMELWNVACSHTLFLNTYITSKRHKKELSRENSSSSYNIYCSSVYFYYLLLLSICNEREVFLWKLLLMF